MTAFWGSLYFWKYKKVTRSHVWRIWRLGIVSDSWATSIRRCFCLGLFGFLLKIQQFLNKFCCHAFHTQNIRKISWHEPIGMPTSSATSLIVIRRSFITISFTLTTFSSVVDVLGRPGRSSSSTSSRPSWKRLYHS